MSATRRHSLSVAFLGLMLFPEPVGAADPAKPDDVLAGLHDFYKKTAKSDGSFRPGIDPEYEGMSDSAASDLAPITYAVVIHKTFGWKLPDEKKTTEFLLSRQEKDGAFVNVAGTVDPKSAAGRAYNTTMAVMALHALGEKPKYDPLPDLPASTQARAPSSGSVSDEWSTATRRSTGDSSPVGRSQRADRPVR